MQTLGGAQIVIRVHLRLILDYAFLLCGFWFITMSVIWFSNLSILFLLIAIGYS